MGGKIEDLVPNAPLRAAFERDPDLTLEEVAERIGWRRKERSRGKVYIHGDTSRVRRALGYASSNGRTESDQEFVTLRTAELLCRALHVDPVDVGI